MTRLLARFFLITCIACLSLLYALPNLYGESPSVQVALKNGQSLPNHIPLLVKALAKQKNIAYEKIEEQADNQLLVRLKQAKQQLPLRDLLKSALPKEYSVSLNLAPKTPHWLQSLGALPMKLGLDLRGGVHFLLAVDTQSVIQTRLNSDLTTLIAELNKKRVAFKSVKRSTQNTLIIEAKDAISLESIRSLATTLSDYNQVKKLTRPNEIQLQLTQASQDRLIDYAINQSITTLNNRVNELGVSEAVIQRQGREHISVDLPGIQDTSRAKELLGKTATLRFHLVDTNQPISQALAQGPAMGSHIYRTEKGRPVILKNEAILTGDAITYATATFRDGRPAVSIQLDGSHARLFQGITAHHIGQPLAVVYVDTEVNQVKNKTITTTHERVINVATIQSALGHQFEVTGLHSMPYAENLALLLRSGALAAPVHIVQELTIGPSLGQHNIAKGIHSLEIGAGLVFLFMLIYYRLFGLIANCALILNIVIIIALLSLIGSTLTLPGIAGIVLTVGMAVDANVLINERIREELRLGLSVSRSIQAGYERAFSTIVDSNVTTLLVGLVLFTLGSGSVKGFAMTLMLGLMASMFTSIYVTRLLVDFVYRPERNPDTLSIGV